MPAPCLRQTEIASGKLFFGLTCSTGKLTKCIQHISNGHVMLVTFTMLLQCVLFKFCILFLPKIYGPCSKPTPLTSDPNSSTTLFGVLFLHKDINFVESVQKKFMRHICIRRKISFNSHSDRLSKLNINLLEYRRLEFDLILMFKIYHNLCDLNIYEFFKLRESRYNLRRHSLAVESLFHPKHEQYHYFFFNRIINMWNNLPESIISAETLSIFKRCLHKFDLHNIANLTY